MELDDGIAGKRYRIRSVTAEEAEVRRLEALGIRRDTIVLIEMKKGNGAMIVSFGGRRLALGKKFTSAIRVTEEVLYENGRR